MKPIAHRSPAVKRSSVDRDRAVARLRRVTIGTTIASITAVGAFGGLAALGDRGIVDGLSTTALTADSNTSTVTDDDSASVDTGTTTTPTTTPTPTVTSTSGAAQATSGGS